MKARSRNNALIFLCLAAFIVLRAVSPDSDPESVITARDWDWRLVSTKPSGALGLVEGDAQVAVRVLGTKESLEARTTAELLWSAGLLGVRIGPPSNASKDELWILPRSATCELADVALAHVQRGGRLLTRTSCPEVLLGLGAPPASAYEGIPGQTAFEQVGLSPTRPCASVYRYLPLHGSSSPVASAPGRP